MRYLSKIFIIGLSILLLVFSFLLLQSANPYDQTDYRISIPKGASATTIQKILERNEIIKLDSSFVFAVKVLGLAKNVKAGEYELSPSDSLLKILLKLKKGEVIAPESLKATFPEGSSIYKMGEILKQNRFSDWKKFQSLVKEGITEPLRKRHWSLFKYISSESLEGYLYPDTYLLLPNTKAEYLAEKMISRFEQVVIPLWLESAADTSLSLHEILTLASIIEKEAQKPKERAIISSVYYNRIKLGMPLAACPTIKYVLKDPTKKVYLDQLKIKSPYNTYKNLGLPPGPICNPGIASIKAAIYPAKTSYYYFVAKKDGSHYFSRTWTEHQNARVKVGLGGNDIE